MRRRYFLLLLIFAGLCTDAGIDARAQDDNGRILVNVNLVQLNVAVTDSKGRYIPGLDPQDFLITEDKIPQKIATFEEGNGPTRSLIDEAAGPSLKTAAATAPASGSAAPASSGGASGLGQLTGAKVFILFDTSNYMYRGFPFAQDSIADFVRSREGASRIAF